MIKRKQAPWHYLIAKSIFRDLCQTLPYYRALYQYFNNNCLFQLANQFKINRFNKVKLFLYKSYKCNIKDLEKKR